MRFGALPASLCRRPGPGEQAAVLRRRPDFPETPAGLFRRGGRPVRAEETDDPFRQGPPRSARAAGEAERAWLRGAVALPDQPSRARR
ncbi:hypothetical protein ACIF8T_03705 [Streptomyces sp. NPDC085946]|uniref:hypothetical protein n=1 Tax=Streptomyces sp. NPDC085946 TaxID=3365744 RepID=UPI0037D1A7E0